MELREVLEEAKKKKNTKYDECPECEVLASELMQKYPEMLHDAQEANIKFLKKLSERSSYRGKCSRTTGKWAYLTGYDYVIEVWGEWWDEASLQEKEALLCHELRHIARVTTSQGKVKWVLRRHDVEEFLEIVNAYGAWEPSLRALSNAIKQYEENTLLKMKMSPIEGDE